jgi:hypothetical protein
VLTLVGAHDLDRPTLALTHSSVTIAESALAISVGRSLTLD